MSGNSKKIDHQFQKLEKKKQELVDLIRHLPEEMYHKQPSTYQWSIGQAANHLFLSETNSLAYLKKKLSYPDAVPPFHVKSWGAVLFTKFTLWSPYKVKAPRAINMWEQQAVLSPAELERKWNELRTDLISFIRIQQPAMGTHLAFKHPFSGRMTMHQMLIFLNDHMAHHLRQIHRIMKKIK